MDDRAQGANDLLANHVRTLEENLRVTADESTHRLAEAAKDVVIALATQGGRVNEALAQNAAQLATSLAEQGDVLADRMTRSSGPLLTAFRVRPALPKASLRLLMAALRPSRPSSMPAPPR